jgi:hypothetical protein
VFKCFVSEHDNDCRNCLWIIDRVDDNKKWFCLTVEFNDEFINRDIVERNLEINVQFFEELSDEILILIIFELNDKLFQATFQTSDAIFIWDYDS